MLGRDVRNKQRCPYGKPSDVAAGQKIIRRSAFLTRKVEADGEDNNKVDCNDRNIDPSESFVGEVCRRFSHAPPFAAYFRSVPCVMLVDPANPGNLRECFSTTG